MARERKRMSQVVLNVPDISCAHCERNIVNALKDQPGIELVQVNIPAKTVHLSFDENQLSRAQVEAILDDEGYPVAGDGAAAQPRPAARPGFIPLRSK